MLIGLMRRVKEVAGSDFLVLNLGILVQWTSQGKIIQKDFIQKTWKLLLLLQQILLLQLRKSEKFNVCHTRVLHKLKRLEQFQWLENGSRMICLQRIASNMITVSPYLHNNFQQPFQTDLTGDEKWICYHKIKHHHQQIS